MSFVQEIPKPAATSRLYAVETLRGLAVLSLVTYHVIGSDSGSGLGQSYPMPLRVFADFLLDIRMPAFAFIAGYVYGLKPIAVGGYRTFVSGKFRRLYIPGAVAAMIFACCATITGKQSGRTLGDSWEILFFPYMHYWFLQSILVIFLIFGALEALTREDAVLPAFIIACLVSLQDPFLLANFMSVNQAIYLAPFFLLGVIFLRYRAYFDIARNWLIPACLLIVVFCSVWNFSILQETGRLSMDRQDLQSLAMGMGTCLLALLVLPHVRWLERFGPWAFTIYLYHVFGTASMRILLNASGIDNLLLNIVLGVAAGLGFPIAIHLLAERHRLTRRLILGKKN